MHHRNAQVEEQSLCRIRQWETQHSVSLVLVRHPQGVVVVGAREARSDLWCHDDARGIDVPNIVSDHGWRLHQELWSMGWALDPLPGIPGFLPPAVQSGGSSVAPRLTLKGNSLVANFAGAAALTVAQCRKYGVNLSLWRFVA